MSRGIWRTLIGIGAIVSAVASTSGQSTGSRLAAVPQTLAVAGSANSTPSLAVAGGTVAAVWTATLGDSVNVYLASSRDGGATFSVPRRVNDQDGDVSANSEQPPRVAIATPGGAPVFTVVWSKRVEGPQRSRRDTMRMARSTDGGRTFSPARFTHDPAFSGARGWQSLTVDPQGAVHAVWLDGRDAERKIADAMAHTGMAHKGQPPQDVYHASVSPDGRIVESLIASNVCFCCKTAVAVDRRGVVYAAWRHVFPGSLRDIAFAKSSDGGRHFDALVRVSEDKWELNGCPEDGPALAVDSAGLVHIAWATLVDDGQPQKALFYATSRDGKTFSPRSRVPTSGVTTPGHPQLTLTPDGGAAIVWDEIVDGVRRVSLARVSRDGVIQRPEILSGAESASNPVIVRTGAGGDGLLVAWTSRAAASGPAGMSVIGIRRIGPQ